MKLLLMIFVGLVAFAGGFICGLMAWGTTKENIESNEYGEDDINVGDMFTSRLNPYTTVEVVEILGDTVYYKYVTSRHYVHPPDSDATCLSKHSFSICYYKP